MRRIGERVLQAATCAALAIAVSLGAGCERPAEPSGNREISTAAMTEDEYIDHVAALTVAVEDGLTGDEARDRAVELGGASYTREELEAFVDILRADPVRWAAVNERIDRRIEEIRTGELGPGVSTVGTTESGGGPVSGGE
jgi:hypothetical protein